MSPTDASQVSSQATPDEELRNAQLERAKKKLKKYQSKKVPSSPSNTVHSSPQSVSSSARGAANLSEPGTPTLRDDPSVNQTKTPTSQRFLQHQRTPVVPAPSTPSLRTSPPLIPIAAPSTPYLGSSSPYTTNHRNSRLPPPSFKLPKQSLETASPNSYSEKPPPAHPTRPVIPVSTSPTKSAGDHKIPSPVSKSSADILLRAGSPTSKISVSQAKRTSAEHGIRSQSISGDTTQAIPNGSSDREHQHRTLQNTITSLIKDKAKLVEDNSGLSSMLEKLKADNTEATSAMQSDIETLNAEVERLRLLQRSLAARLDEQTLERKEYEEEAKKNIEMKEKEAMDAIKKVHEVETRHRIQVTMINKLQKDNATFRKKVIEAKAATYSSPSSETNLFNAPVSASLPTTPTELQQPPALVGDLISQRTQLQTEIATLKEKHDMAEGEIDNLRADLHIAKRRIEDLTKQHEKSAAGVLQEKFQTEIAQKRIEELKGEMQKEREEWELELTKYEESTKSLLKQIEDAKIDTEKSKLELAKSEDHLAQVMERNSKSMAEANERMEKLKVDNHGMVGQLEELRQKVIQLSNEKMVESDEANSARFRVKKLEEQIEIGDMYKQELESLREIMRQREQLEDKERSNADAASERELTYAGGVDPEGLDEKDRTTSAEPPERKNATIQTDGIDLETVPETSLSPDRTLSDVGPDLGAAASILQFENNRLATRCAELVSEKGDILLELKQYKQKMEEMKKRAREKRGVRKEEEWHADARRRSKTGWVWKGDSGEDHTSVSPETTDVQNREGDETDTLASDWSLSSADEADLVEMDVLDVPSVQGDENEDDGTRIRPRRAASVPTLPKFLENTVTANKEHQLSPTDQSPRKSLPEIERTWALSDAPSLAATNEGVTIDSEGKDGDGLIGERSETRSQTDGINLSVVASANGRKQKKQGRAKIIAQEMRGLRKQVASAQLTNEELASRLARELHINELLAHENSQIADYVVLYHAERRALIHQTQKALQRARSDREFTPDRMSAPPPTPVSPITGRSQQQLARTTYASSSSLSNPEDNSTMESTVSIPDVRALPTSTFTGNNSGGVPSLIDFPDQLASRRRVGGINIRMEVRQFQPCKGCFNEEFIV